MLSKVTIVGAGHVGATTAQRVAEMELGREVVLVDILEGIPQGKALDEWQAGPILGSDTRVVGTNAYDETRGSDLVVITAGIARKPGMSREDLLSTNARIVERVASKVKGTSPSAILLVVSNPLDAMCYVALRTTDFPRERVFGMAGVLDTARYRAFVAEAAGVSVRDVQALVLGGHGDTMVPLVSYTTISGVPVRQFLNDATIERLVRRTREGGAEIVKYLKEGSAYYAPSAAVAEMVEAVAQDKKRLLPAAAWLEGEYGFRGIYLGVPCRLGRRGLEGILEVELTADERRALERSADAVRRQIEWLESAEAKAKAP